jgi:hypothetical protein
MSAMIDRSRVLLACVSFACVGFGPCSSDEWGTWTGYEKVPCLPGGGPRLLDELTPVEPFAYVELRALPGSSDSAFAQRDGNACVGASDQDACKTALADLSVKSGIRFGDCAQSCSTYVLVHNLAEKTGVVTSRVDLVRYLAPIDTKSEALLLVASDGYDISCSDETKSGVLLEHDSGVGIGVIATRFRTTCDPAEEWQYDLVVAPDGSIEVIQSKLWESHDVCLD